MPEPVDIPLDIQGSLAWQDVELAMLVGLPGELSLVLRRHSHGAPLSAFSIHCPLVVLAVGSLLAPCWSQDT